MYQKQSSVVGRHKQQAASPVVECIVRYNKQKRLDAVVEVAAAAAGARKTAR